MQTKLSLYRKLVLQTKLYIMDTNKTNTEYFDENKSLQVIREMIFTSQKKIKNDGILFIIWGWLMFYNYISSFILRQIVITHSIKMGFKYFGTGFGILTIAFSIYYIIKKGRRVTTYIGISLRYVWVSLFICLSLINMIIFNVIHEFNVELQHPVFMVLIAFAIVVTGGILRYKLLIIGGVIFGILAYVCSYLKIDNQMLAEAIAWLIAFVIPGHIMHSKRKRD